MSQFHKKRETHIDNELWLRHLQTLAVQVVAAAYVLYESFVLGGDRSPPLSSLLLPAAIVMFAVGVAKYGERVWALKCAGSSPSSGGNYRSFDRSRAFAVGPSSTGRRDTEGFLSMTHRLLPVPMDLLKEPSRFVDLHYGTSEFRGEDFYRVAEVQLSLMHDVLYTKAEAAHTWYGRCVRVFSPLATAVALSLFVLLDVDFRRRSNRRRYSRVDVAVTYVLLVGAVVLEITSALRAIFSSWTCALLEERKEGEGWHFLARVVASLRRLVRAADWRKRYWSCSMGQHNLLQLCARSRGSRRSKIARWMGVEDPWNTFAYSSSVPVSERVKKLLVSQVVQSAEDDASSSSRSRPADDDDIRLSRGRAALKKNSRLSRRLYDDLGWSIDGIDFDESILVWHIATDMYLYWYRKQAKPAEDDDDAQAQLRGLVAAAEELSNYMLFLLAARTYMLPPPASRNAYVHACHFLAFLKRESPEELADDLRRNGDALNRRSNADQDTAGDTFRYRNRLNRATQLGAKLIGEGLPAADMLTLISQLWVEMLCYAGHRCSAYSHAKQISNGGELVTVAAILMEHIRRRTSMPLFIVLLCISSLP